MDVSKNKFELENNCLGILGSLGGPLSISKLYNDGFCVLDVSHLESFHYLWGYILQDPCVIEEGSAYDVRSPLWDNKTDLYTDNSHVPKEYQKLIEDIVSTGLLKPYTNIHGDFNKFIYMGHFTGAGYKNPWHGHFFDGMHIHLLIHFGHKNRDYNEDGGVLEVGRAIGNLDMEDYTNIKLPINKSGHVLCNHGEMTVMLNSDPFVMHQVTEVKSEKTRYTLMVGCGYQDNVVIDKVKINHL